MLPKDPNDEKNVILEVRAGTGGEEAALFAGDLFRAYQKYAALKGWRVELVSESPGALGGSVHPGIAAGDSGFCAKAWRISVSNNS